MLNRSVTQLRPQITDIVQSITQLLQQIRQIRTQFENEITIIRGRFTQQHRIIVNVIIESRDTAYRVELGRLIFQTRFNQLQREYLTEEERLLQAQLSTQVRIFIQNEQTHLTALRQYENQHRQTIESNRDIQRCLQIDTVKSQLQQIEARNATLFQQAEIISQQLLLAVANPEGNQLFPKITNVTFWSHVYRKRFNQSIQRNFAGTEQYAYNIPTLDQLNIDISSNYGTTIIQNIVMHLLNTRLWVVHIFKSYFLHQQYPRQPQEPEPQQ
ncbi:hypothetical protein INT48_005787 [Thamnidium elegans]|uniref:Uncharacterized protein n=1 Tax=Thamnidium elegans TaxID=101142 RepID=A0A8H7SW82_9FUNG|nr:hypothetical protein INT48_005787 [Thamnidium elegans]